MAAILDLDVQEMSECKILLNKWISCPQKNLYVSILIKKYD